MNVKKKTAPEPKTPAAPTIATEQKRCRVETIIVNILCLFVFLAFGYIAVMSFFQTSQIKQSATDPDLFARENILFQNDIVLLNIIVTVLFFLFLFAMRRFYDFFAKVNITAMEIALAALTVTLGLIWVFSVRSIPSADSANIFEAATDAAQNNYKSMQNDTQFYNWRFYSYPPGSQNSAPYITFSYFHFYPFQLGFVFFCEIIYRIFGVDSSMPVQVLNVLAVAASYFALARITRLLFKRKSVEFMAILLLMVCFQPILFTTFVYGNLIGMCYALWASLLLIKYFQTQKYRWAIISGVLLVLATLAKYNNMIYLAAFVIMLVIHIFKKQRQPSENRKGNAAQRFFGSINWQSAVVAAAMTVAVLGSNALVIAMYENRSGTKFESGVSQTIYLDMGLQESSMAPGWYTTIGKNTYMNKFLVPKYYDHKDIDVSSANDAAKEDIEKRLEKFSEDMDYTLDFFSKKILSQWNEPTFESVWVSQVKQHTASDEDKERLKIKGDRISSTQMKGLAESVYYKSTGQILNFHFNLYMQLIYLMFAVGIYLMFVQKKTNIETVLLPLVLLGAFGYHLLFEGKSQYILTYIPLLIPTAAYAFNVILNGKYEKLKKLFAKINYIPDKFNEKTS